MVSTALFVLTAVFALVYYILKRRLNYWKNKNVPYVKPAPILGNYGGFILIRKHISYVLNELCQQLPNEPYIGAFYGTEPTLIVKDPELLKLITTKDFYYFNGRETSAYVHKEQFTQNLFNNNGDEWKVVRQNLTPIFTSAKMKNMFYLIEKCVYEYEKLLDAEFETSNRMEIRKLMSRFTMACITLCAFGVDSNTLGEGYKESPFTKVGDSFFSGSISLVAKNIAKSIWPGIFYSFGLSVVPPGVNEFFKKFIFSVFEARQYKPSSRHDFVDFILNFKKNDYIVGDSIENLITGDNKKVQLPVTDELLLSQCVLFFLAGFETSATTASYTMYELAKNPEVQKKVHEEIDAYLQKYENKLTYDIVNELPYTYACVEETLRLYPVLVNLTREVVDDYTLPTGVRLEKGIRIHIPVYHMHRDPKFFPEPEEYRPERFFGEERKNIIPYSYMPFGEGSRVCIGELKTQIPNCWLEHLLT